MGVRVYPKEKLYSGTPEYVLAGIMLETLAEN